MIDRTSTIKFPVKMEIMDQCRMPEFKKQTTSLEELCEQRARWLLDHAIKTNRKLGIMYSGGIDSTLIMVSLFKIASDEELYNHCVCIMNDLSIAENPNFYNNYIVKKMRIKSSNAFDLFLGNDKYVVVSGEGGDQLFSAGMIEYMFANYSQERLTEFVNKIYELRKNNSNNTAG